MSVINGLGIDRDQVQLGAGQMQRNMLRPGNGLATVPACDPAQLGIEWS